MTAPPAIVPYGVLAPGSNLHAPFGRVTHEAGEMYPGTIMFRIKGDFDGTALLDLFKKRWVFRTGIYAYHIFNTSPETSPPTSADQTIKFYIFRLSDYGLYVATKSTYDGPNAKPEDVEKALISLNVPGNPTQLEFIEPPKPATPTP